MTRSFSFHALGLHALAAAALVGVMAAPALAAPSRAELERSVIQLENALADAQNRISTLEERQLTGDPAAVAIQQQIQSIQAELVRVTGQLEDARFQNTRLRNELRALRREIQLRDAEIAEKLGLEPAFVGGDDLAFDEGASSGFGPGLQASSSGGQPVPEGQNPFAANPFNTQPGAARNDAAQPGGLQAGGAEPPLGEPGTPSAGATAPVETDPSFFGDDPYAAQRAAAVGTLGQRAPLPDNAVDALAAAKRLLIDGRFDEAESAFAEFQERYGDSPQAGEALYWQGEAKFLRGAYEEAKNLYINSLRADPSGPRAPDAMVALASSLQNMDHSDEACSTLASFPTQFPNAALSVRAKADRVRQAAGCR